MAIQTRYAVHNTRTGESVDYANPSAAQEVADHYRRTGIPFTTSTFERTIRPIEVGDRADAPMPFGGMIVRGTVVDITHPTAILDLDDGGRISVMVDDLDPIAPGRTVARRERHRGMMAGATALAVTATPNGIEFDIHTADAAEDTPGFERTVALLAFGDAADIHRVLGELLNNPGDAEKLKPIRELHFKVDGFGAPLCSECPVPWPCKTAKLVYADSELA